MLWRVKDNLITCHTDGSVIEMTKQTDNREDTKEIILKSYTLYKINA
jgi:hypothetical protein